MSALAVLVAVLTLLIGALVVFNIWVARKVVQGMPPHGKFIDLGGQKMHYIDEGAGRPLVLVHGLGGQLRNFSYAMVEPLSKNFRVIAIDRPGAGYSTRSLKTASSLEHQAQAVIDLIKKLKLEKPLVVGHSMGGAIALAVALAEPDLISGLALIAPLTHNEAVAPHPFKRLVITNDWVRLGVAYTLSVPLAIRLGQKTLDAVFAPDPAPDDMPTRGGGMLGLRPKAFFHTSKDLSQLPSGLPAQQARYQEITMPVGILFGTEDAILDVRRQGEIMRDKLPALDLQLIAGGHMLPIVVPAICVDFVSRIAKRAMP